MSDMKGFFKKIMLIPVDIIGWILWNMTTLIFSLIITVGEGIQALKKWKRSL